MQKQTEKAKKDSVMQVGNIAVPSRNLTLVFQLSEKFDRDRLGLPLSTLRTTKERSIAPHLASGSTRVSTTQAQGTIAARRAETREASKKKAGESGEDWRRGMPLSILAVIY